jgi:hypothetical protein
VKNQRGRKTIPKKKTPTIHPPGWHPLAFVSRYTQKRTNNRAIDPEISAIRVNSPSISPLQEIRK